VGTKTASRLIEYFGSQEAALAVIEGRDIAALSRVPGVGERGALTLVQEYIAHIEGVEAGSFLRTQEAQRVYERLMGLLRPFAHTSQSRAKLGLYFPLPGDCLKRIIHTQHTISPYIELARALTPELIESLNSHLRQVKPLRHGTNNRSTRQQLVIVENENRAEELRTAGLDRFSDITVASDSREIAEIARGYSSAVVLGRHLMELELPGNVQVEYVDDAEHLSWMIPAATLDFYVANLPSLLACLNVLKSVNDHLGLYLPDFKPPIEPKEITRLEHALSGIGGDGCVSEGASEECDRLRGALERLDETVTLKLDEANQRLSEVLQSSSVTISGEDIIPLLGANEDPGIRTLLACEIRETYRDACNKFVDGVCSELDLSSVEAHPLEESLPDEVTYPLQAHPPALKRMRNELESALHQRELGLRQASARELCEFTTMVSELIDWGLEFDALFAVGLFALEYDMKLPELVGEPVLDLKDGANIFLKAGGGEVEPVSYALGVVRGELQGEKITLLSGVNSGGKTSLLDLLAQCIVLGHMGFPVPAQGLKLGVTEKFYYFSKSRGTLSAGAFEATLRNFAPVSRPGSKVVLADELESITEPGASARIVSGILESIHDEPKNLAVVVSHLSEQIVDHCSWPVRVDGIEASGLDADFNLVIDRSPRYNYLARSTPELIVERLVLGSAEDDKQFYLRLKAKFDDRNELVREREPAFKTLWRRSSTADLMETTSQDCAYPQ